MVRYLLTDQSKQDIIQIRRFTLERWGAKQSALYISELRKTLHLLSDMPEMGTRCFDDHDKDVYQFPFNTHTVYYLKYSEKGIVVIAVLHQSMVPEIHLGSRF